MRVTEKLKDNQSWGDYFDDIPGGTEVQCENCGKVHKVLCTDNEPLFCSCGNEVMYASWWEW